MARKKLVRRGGRLLRINGRLVRSSIDLDPDAPCECCEEPPPPDFVTYKCNARTGVCSPVLNDPTGYATEALCLANCHAATTTWNCTPSPDEFLSPCNPVANNTGTYLTEAECLANCQNPFL